MFIIKNPAFLIVCVVIIGALFILSSSGQMTVTNDSSAQMQTPTPPSENEIKRSFPKIEYQAERPGDEARRLKGQKYDKYKVLDPNICEDNQEVSYVDWIGATSALPVAESDLVVMGSVVEATAHLSQNKNSVYSEFRIEVEKVFKNKSNAVFEQEKYLRVERDGGIVTFPNGFKTWYMLSGQRMPAVGGRYILFLTHSFPLAARQTRDLYLLTAYQLKGGIVYPLDSANGGEHRTATECKGKSETALVSDLEKRLKNGNFDPPVQGRP